MTPAEYAIGYLARVDLYLITDEFKDTKRARLDDELVQWLDRYSRFVARHRGGWGDLRADADGLGTSEFAAIIGGLVYRREALSAPAWRPAMVWNANPAVIVAAGE